MHFTFTEEQQLLADTVQRFVREHYDFDARRAILHSQAGWSREKWLELAGLGLTALNVPEEHGGLNAGPLETLLVMNALGAGLVLEPYWSTAVIAPALLDSLRADASAELLTNIASGEQIVVVAHLEHAGRGSVDWIETRASRRGTGYVLNGRKSVVAHGGIADVLLISARTNDAPQSREGVCVFRVTPDLPGVTVKSYRTVDGQNAADVELRNVEVSAANLLGPEGGGSDGIERAYDLALSALCAEGVGIMKAANASTIEYMKNRKQFGQPIARFQALQHRMADMFIHAEQALSMSYLAAVRCVDSDRQARRRALSAAKAVIGQAGRFIAQQSVQLHGGMGMTDEMMISHYFKRLTAIDLTLGDADFHLQQLASLEGAES